MKNHFLASAIPWVTLLVVAGFGSSARAQREAKPGAPVSQKVPRGAAMSLQAVGTFDVKITPQPADDASLGRMTIDKTLKGGLEATSQGQMLTAMTAVKGSAGYVAIERITGTLDGRAGSFILQHTGTMTRGAPELSITVVPDSGTGQLTGITGKMTIKIADGKHSYIFDYSLPSAP